MSSDGQNRRPVLERALDAPERALLWLPWPSTPRILFRGSFGFLKQIIRSLSPGGLGGLGRNR